MVIGANSINESSFFCPKQVHGIDIIEVHSHSDPVSEADACYTFNEAVTLAVKTADCLPVILYTSAKHDPVMSIHAGWKGFSKNILKKAFNKYIDLKKSDSRCEVLIGPAISRKNFEIGPDVYEMIQSSEALGPSDFHACTTKGARDRWHFDLQQAACLSFNSLGVGTENISVIKDCTFENESLHSFRREKNLCGHNYTLVKKKYG